MEFLQRLWTDEEGQGMTEYGLILAIIAVAAIAVLVTLGPKIVAFFSDAEDAIDTLP